METNGLHRDHKAERELHGSSNRGGRPENMYIGDELDGTDLSTWEQVTMPFHIGVSCPWYPNGTSSLWRITPEDEASTSYRFTVLYVGGPEPLEYKIISHGAIYDL